MSHIVSTSVHLSLLPSALCRVIDLVQGFLFLLHCQHWALPGLFLEIVLWSCLMEILLLWVCRTSPLSALADHRWGGRWDGPTHSPGSEPGWLQGLLALPSLHHQGELSSSPYTARSKGWGGFSRFHILRAGSISPIPLGSALLCCSVKKMQGLLSYCCIW